MNADNAPLQIFHYGTAPVNDGGEYRKTHLEGESYQNRLPPCRSFHHRNGSHSREDSKHSVAHVVPMSVLMVVAGKRTWGEGTDRKVVPISVVLVERDLVWYGTALMLYNNGCCMLRRGRINLLVPFLFLHSLRALL
jgi:hypothetical protein